MEEQGGRTIVTAHGKKRTKNRLGLSKKNADKQADKALEFGVPHAAAKGRLKKYMDGLYLRHEQGNNNRVYNRKVYIFQGNILITILNLPNYLAGTADSIQKKIAAQAIEGEPS